MKHLELAVFTTLLITGCVPQMEPDIPELTGTVTRSGAPILGATILVSDRLDGKRPCQHVRPVAKTDHLGKFHYKGERSLHLAVIAGDPKPHWEMCVQLGETIWLGMRSAGFGLQDSMDIGRCDIAHTPPQDPWGEGICRGDAYQTPPQ